MPAPPCQCCGQREPATTSPTIAAAAKARAGVPNASQLTGLAASLALQLLDGDPWEGSEYEGYWRTISYTATYPVSRFDDDEGEWVSSRTITETWTREHYGDDVVDSLALVTFTDEQDGPDFTLDEDEAIRFSDEDEPTANGGFLRGSPVDLDACTVAVDGAVGKDALLAHVGDLPDEWGTLNQAQIACPSLAGYGIAGGVTLSDYDTEWPSRAERIAVRWGLRIAGVGGDFGVPLWGDEKSLRAAADSWTIDLTDDDPPPPVISTSSQELAWRPAQYAWATMVDAANPDGAGWFALEPTSPGEVRVVDNSDRTYILDLAPIVHS